jgi:hypothetical protein
MLNTINLIIEYDWDYNFVKDDLLLEHFFNHDRVLGVDSIEEHYYVKKIIDNQALPSGSIQPHNMLLQEKELADLKLAGEFIIKYKQPTKFSDVSDNLDEVYQAVVKCASYYQKNQYELELANVLHLSLISIIANFCNAQTHTNDLLYIPFFTKKIKSRVNE